MSFEAFTIAPASKAHTAGLLELFERTGCPCYCRYFHFEGDKNAWLNRCANETDLNRAEMCAALERDSDEMCGVVAVENSGAYEHEPAANANVIGWMKITRASALEKLYAQRLYKGLACFSGQREKVFSIACFLIDGAWRRKGVARALLARGIELAQGRGATAIEAFPRRSEDAPDEQLWTGPCGIFEAAGFAEVHALGPYPVLRLTC